MKNLRWIVLSLFLSGAALIGLFALTFTPETRAYLGQVSIAAIFFALGLQAAAYLCRLSRLRVLCQSLGYTVSFSALTLVLFLSLFAGAITPGQIGGEPVRIHRLSISGLAVGDATTVVVVERVLDLVVFFSLTFTILLSLRSLWGYLAATVLYPVTAFLILALTLVLLLGILIRHPSLMKQVVGSISTLILNRCGQSQRWSRFCPGIGDARSLKTKIDQEIEIFTEGFSWFARGGRRALGGALLATVLEWTLTFSVASALLVALELPPSIPESFLFQGILQMITNIPLVPGAAGISEIGAATLYRQIVPAYLLGLFVILWRLILYYLNIPLGLIASVFAVRGRTGEIDDDESGTQHTENL